MKKVSLLIAVIMLVTLMTPAFAAENSMAYVLKTVKERVEIPAECTEFSSNTNVSGGNTEYSFSWSTTQKADNSKGVYVTVTDKCLIKNYYIYGENAKEEQRLYYKNKTIPQISKETALLSAQAFLEKVNPDISAEYDFSDADVSFYSTAYQILAPRKANGIKTNNNVSVTVSAESGKVTSFSIDYTENAVFPSAGSAMSVEKAEEIFRSGALKKIYNDFYNGEMAQIVWVPTGFSQIDAVNGERFNVAEEFARNTAEGSLYAKAQDSLYEEAFTEEELAELSAVAGLISMDEAEKKIRSMSELDISGTEISGFSVTKLGERYMTEISFEDEDYFGNAVLDAETGQMLSFWSYNGKIYGDKEFDDGFIKKYYSDYISRTKVVDNSYRVRIENGIEYPADTISCEKDKKSGKVTSFSIRFDEAEEFEMPEDIADEAAVYDVLFEKIKPELYYVLDGKKEARLIYELDFSDVSFIDAQTLKMLGYDGNEQTAPISSREYAYTDISGHFAEEAIKALASIDVGFQDAEFKPNNIITQKEYAALLSQCIYDYVIFESGAVNIDKTSEYFVRTLGINGEEFKSDEPLTREKALKYLLDAGAGEFSKTAGIKGIFKTGFADENEIDQDLLGYVAIAKGLHIVNGSSDGNFYPKANVTRGEAAVMIYNYLK